ncbi:MAG: ATP-binding protein [Acidobacteriota bacterium]
MLRGTGGQPTMNMAGHSTRGTLVEEYLSRRDKELSVLNGLTQKVTAQQSLADACDAAVHELLSALELDMAVLYVKDGEALVLRGCARRAETVASAEVQAMPGVRPGDCICGRAARERRPVYSGDIISYGSCAETQCQEFGFRSFVAVPMILADELIGVLGLASVNERDFARRARFLETAGDHLAVGISNARLLERTRAYAARLEQQMAELRQAEDERQRLQAQLVQAQKMEAVGQLASGVAHDFNNILAAILMYLGLLQAEPDINSEMRSVLGDLETQANRAAGLTRQLLMFSRRQVMQTQVFDLNSLLGNLLKMLRRLIGEDIGLEFKGEAAALWVEADPGMLEQVVMNLVVNARDAMPHGGRLTLATRSVVLDESYSKQNPEGRGGRFVCLSVADTGVGMDEATVKHIFEPFFTTKEPGRGTGLGLATVYGILRQHGGWVEAESTVGKGSTFRVFLPEHPQAAKLEADEANEPCTGGRETILVVEDEPSVRSVIARALHRCGYHVMEAANGQMALGMWRQRQGRIDLLLTDMVMPEGMTGLELAEQLCRENRNLKVMLMSGYNPELVRHAHRGVAYLSKPFTAKVLARAIRDHLDSKDS